MNAITGSKHANLARLALLGATTLLTFTAKAEDWPRWRGPNLDGISTEKGWQAQWPETGPKKLWDAEVGIGYSTVAVAKGKVYTMGNVQETDRVSCFDAETGKLVWKHEYPCASKDPNGYHGTRTTPTVDGTRVYTLSRHGHLFCLDANDGKVIWSKEFKKDFSASPPQWGWAGSVLIEKDWALIEVGGAGRSVVAFNKATGDVVWKNGDDGAGYSSLVPFDLEGERCLAVFSAENFVCRKMKDGAELWRTPWKTSYGVNAATPIIQGNKLFLSSGYNFGCALFEMTKSEAKELWRNKSMRNHVNSCVLVDGYIYGFDENTLNCLDFKTGEVKWGEGKFGKASLEVADGKFIIWSQKGKLATAEISPVGFKQISSAQILEGKDTWASPVLANGRIYVRNLDHIACVDVKK
jgi:outer membrane protein assembly factor BamB